MSWSEQGKWYTVCVLYSLVGVQPPAVLGGGGGGGSALATLHSVGQLPPPG